MYFQDETLSFILIDINSIFSRDPESMAGSDSDTESMMSSVSGFGRKKKKRWVDEERFVRMKYFRR